LLTEELRNVGSLAADQVSEYTMGEYETGMVGLGNAYEFLIVKPGRNIHFGDLYTAEGGRETES
jgi:hypothetical protein